MKLLDYYTFYPNSTMEFQFHNEWCGPTFDITKDGRKLARIAMDKDYMHRLGNMFAGDRRLKDRVIERLR